MVKPPDSTPPSEHTKALIDIALSNKDAKAGTLRQIAMDALKWKVIPDGVERTSNDNR